ncbi:MAG: helix-hairpin-helix domain-containing protein [Betaproteobacteria bacterium]|nr:helix-hairpin-helix domain-containing protein [Betaproteobacteria bacterium]
MKKLIFGFIFTLFAALSLSAFAAVDINTATKEELQTLNGIGPDKAQAIVDYRTQHGAFKSVKDLRHVKGIGKKTISKLGDNVTVSGEAAKAPAKKEHADHAAHHHHNRAKAQEAPAPAPAPAAPAPAPAPAPAAPAAAK